LNIGLFCGSFDELIRIWNTHTRLVGGVYGSFCAEIHGSFCAEIHGFVAEIHDVFDDIHGFLAEIHGSFDENMALLMIQVDF